MVWSGVVWCGGVIVCVRGGLVWCGVVWAVVWWLMMVWKD